MIYEIKKDGERVDLVESLTWVREQKNGVIITCESEIGVGILCGSYQKDDSGNEVFQNNSAIYSVVGKPQLKDYAFVEINKLNWYQVAEQQRADVEYLAIMVGVDL